MTFLRTSGFNHTSVEHAAPHMRGGANQENHRPHPIRGEGTRPKKTTQEVGESNKQEDYPLDSRQGGGYHGAGGGGQRGEGVQQPCITYVCFA